MKANHHPMRALHLYFSPLAVALFLLAAAQPAWGHHYAERVPGHGHVVLGEVAPEQWVEVVAHHVHVYEQQHTHPAAMRQANGAPTEPHHPGWW